MFSGGKEGISGTKLVIKRSDTAALIWCFLLLRLLVRNFIKARLFTL